MSGADIAAEVAEAIRSASAEVGTGTPLKGTITRTTGADESTYPPTPGAPTTYSLDVLSMTYSTMDRNGTQITARDVKIMVAPDGETVPVNSDDIEVSGVTYDVQNVEPYQPGGVVLYYVVQARSGQ